MEKHTTGMEKLVVHQILTPYVNIIYSISQPCPDLVTSVTFVEITYIV
jgi:hypothetical protein